MLSLFFFCNHSIDCEIIVKPDIRNCYFVLFGLCPEGLTLLLFFFPFRIFDFLTGSLGMLCYFDTVASLYHVTRALSDTSTFLDMDRHPQLLPYVSVFLRASGINLLNFFFFFFFFVLPQTLDWPLKNLKGSYGPLELC